MDLTQYITQAQTTAEPRAYHHAYLRPGIIGELGELHGHIAKEYWHEKDRSAEITAEYGDVAWLTALLISTVPVNDRVPARSPRAEASDQDGALAVLLARAVAATRDPRRALSLWVALEHYSFTITGCTFDEVLTGNLAKLADRAARGVLRGSGDHR